MTHSPTTTVINIIITIIISIIIIIITEPAQPAEVIFVEILTRSVEFTWGEVFTNFDQYVYEIMPLQGENIGIVQPGNVRTGSFAGLVPGRRYDVTVSAGTLSDTKSFRTSKLEYLFWFYSYTPMYILSTFPS